MSTVAKIGYGEYEAMIERGDFAVDDPRQYELIDGEIRTMPSPDPIHEEAIDRLNRWSSVNLPFELARVRIQGTIGIPDLDSLLLPDAAWLRETDYSTRRPLPEDVFLVIEVANSSPSYDCNTKARLYAAADLADYWIANIRGRCFEVLRDPGRSGYRSKQMYYPGDFIHPLAFPELAFPVSLIFPDPENGAKP